MPFSRALFPFILISLVSFSLFAQEPDPQTVQETLTLFKFENALPDTAFNAFNRYLAPKMEHELKTGFSVAFTDQIFESLRADSLVRGALRIALFGRFEKGTDGNGMLRFKIRDVKTNAEEEKIIALNYMEKEDIAQIILLKTRNFLTRSILGAVAITSSPLGCAIALDGKTEGFTPREFFLMSGTHSLELTREHFAPYREDFTVYPGRALNVGAQMEFKGYPTRYWFLGATAATWELAIMWVLEQNSHRDWKNNAMPNSYTRYRNVRYLRISLLSLAGIGWIGTGYCHFSNKSLKNKLVAKTD